MPRRVNLPAADDLFRKTGEHTRVRAVPDQPDPGTSSQATKRPSGRVRHDEKMTVYVTAAELLELEHARLRLRSDHGLAIDRGRLVREALSLVLADFEEKGHDSVLVQRLFEE